MCDDTLAKLSALKAQVAALTAERDAARRVIVKLWPAFPVGSNYVLDAADKVAIVAALQAVRKE